LAAVSCSRMKASKGAPREIFGGVRTSPDLLIRFQFSVHPALQRGALEVLEMVPEDLRRGKHEERLALLRREPEPDKRAPNPGHGVARHVVELQAFSPPEALARDVKTFLREPPNRGVSPIHLVRAHT